MESSLVQRNHRRQKRARALRRTLRGTSAKPRLSVMRSNQHISAQLIDDEAGVTLASAGTQMKKFRGSSGKNKAAAKLIGSEIAELAKKKSIASAIFDRGFRQYHGVIAELADAAREGGLQF